MPKLKDNGPYPSPENKRVLIEAELDKMRRKGIIENSIEESRQIVSPIFSRPKKEGGLRVILDLTELEKHIVYRHFKMEILETALNLITPNCFMSSVDWKDAYYTIPVACSDRKFLKFRWNDTLFQYTALPNGLCPLCP